MLKLSCAVAALVAVPLAAHAQTQPTPPRPAQGQPPQGQPASGPENINDEGELVVTGEIRGAVKTDIKPEVTLSPADIQAYGVSNVSELITALAPQLGSGQGRGGEQPVILLSGRRSTMNEVASLPPEAIERIDIMPEEVALQYGYSASQKVINIVLRPRFQALTADLEARAPTAGGNSGQHGEGDILKLNRNGRVELNAVYDHSSNILESERGVTRAGTSLFDTRGNIIGLNGGEIDPVLSALAGSTVTVAGVPEGAATGAPGLSAFAANHPNVSDLTPYRTLIGPQTKLTLKGTYNRAFSPHLSGTATVQLDVNESQSWLGLPSVTLRLPAGDPFSPFTRDVTLLRYLDTQKPLERAVSGQTLHGEYTLNSDVAPWSKLWNWSFQGSYDRATSETITSNSTIDPVQMQVLLDARSPSFNPFAPIQSSLITVRAADTANTVSNVGNVEFLTNGPLFALPAGKVNASIRLRGRTNDLSSESFRNSTLTSADISRQSASVRGNLNIPIASRRTAVLQPLGDLTLNGNFEVEQVSDFGRLTTVGYGFNWSPITQIQARVNWTDDSNAPSPQQLGNPVIRTPNVRVFDYVTGQSVDITSITGGNPALLADSRHVFNVGLNIRPFTKTDLGIFGTFTRQHYRNQSQNLPGATVEIENAFPDRFVRDGAGNLLSVDYRPINFDSTDHEELRWGINLSLPIASSQAKKIQARREAFQKAFAESRRTGQPLPPEFAAQLAQFRRIGQQGSLFGTPQGAQRPQGQGQGQGQGPQGGDGQPRGDGQGGGRFQGGGGFRGGGGRGGFSGNRLLFSLFHTWVLKDEVVIRPGLPAIDRLNNPISGNAISAHRIDARIGMRRDWMVFGVNGSWQSGNQVSTGTLGNGDRLDFGSLTKVNLQAELNFGQNIDLLLKHPWLRGTRISLNLDNVFDARQRVTDQTGATPPAYAPNLMDPLGRIVRLTIRKQFF
jgi:uncharacterized membrane protein YgcG